MCEFKKIVSVFTSLLIIISILTIFPINSITVFATQQKYNNFSKNYTLSGYGANDMLAVAFAQVGKSKTEFGYTEAWCADFVCDCAYLAGQTSAIPLNGAVSHPYQDVKGERWYGLLELVLRAGGVKTTNPQPGDLVFWKNTAISHVEIVCRVDNSVTYSIGGNNTVKRTSGNYNGCAGERKCTDINSNILCYVRPNYSGVPIPTEPPTYSVLTSNKTNYNLGEEVSFTASSDTATGYTIGINKGDTRIITQDLNGNTFSFVPTSGGNYTAYVTAWNSAGLKDSDVISFSVYGSSPTNPILQIKGGKSIFAEDETIEFIADSSGATGYTIGIDKNGERIVTKDLNGNTFSFKPQGSGEYYSYVTAWNNAGLTDSKGICFKVYNSAPSKSDIALVNEKSVYEVGNAIDISVVSDTATGYTIGIDKNGERIVTKDFSDNIYKFVPSEPGDYYTYVTSWNKYGIKDSKGICFKVCASKPTFSELSVSTNTVGIGEQIEFNSKSDNANTFWIGIDHNGERYLTEEMVNGKLICTFDEIGDYTAYVTSSNKFGYVDSKLIRFTVYSSISGDCNNDGEFSVSDVVMLQKWLLADPSAKLTNWKAADLCKDDKLDVFDLCLMKRILISK